MDIFNAYTQAITISLIIIISYFFNYVSKKTNIPSVLLLIGLGIGIQELLQRMAVDVSAYVMAALELLGVVGLIMIVLEASLDLALTRDKKPLLVRSFVVALLSLIATMFAIGYIFHIYLIDDFFSALMYAIPLSILSSAIIIPSVANLVDDKKEFMIYESSFSDILGIMLFYFMISGHKAAGITQVVTEISGSIVITVILSLVISYALVLLLQHLQSKVKLFFLISVLVLLYATGKLFHLSSLMTIMVFGIVLNNYKIFFKGKFRKLIKPESLNEITEDFHLVTMETAFVVRTFFFVIFGMTLDFSGITDLNAIYISLGVLASTFFIRFVFLRFFVGKNIFPQLWIAPRGLVTVLLFFSIPLQFQDESFNSTILLIVILASSLIMSGGLMVKKEEEEVSLELSFDDWQELDDEIRELTGKDKNLSEKADVDSDS